MSGVFSMCADPIHVIGGVFLLSFALLTALAGAFTLYFGAGKSRRIGGALLAVGLVIVAIYAFALTTDAEWFIFEDVDIFGAALVVLGVILGAIVAAGLFLMAIIKS